MRENGHATLPPQHQQGRWYPGHQVRQMVRNINQENQRQEQVADCSPPFSQVLPDGDDSLLRMKILEKLKTEDVRDVLEGLRAGPL